MLGAFFALKILFVIGPFGSKIDKLVGLEILDLTKPFSVVPIYTSLSITVAQVKVGV